MRIDRLHVEFFDRIVKKQRVRPGDVAFQDCGERSVVDDIRRLEIYIPCDRGSADIHLEDVAGSVVNRGVLASVVGSRIGHVGFGILVSADE